MFRSRSRNVQERWFRRPGNSSTNDPYPEGGSFHHHLGQPNSPEADMVTETHPHMVTENYSHRRPYISHKVQNWQNTRVFCTFFQLKFFLKTRTKQFLQSYREFHPKIPKNSLPPSEADKKKLLLQITCVVRLFLWTFRTIFDNLPKKFSIKSKIFSIIVRNGLRRWGYMYEKKITGYKSLVD